MGHSRTPEPSPERARGTTERASEDLAWENPPGTSRTKPGSHSTGGRKDHALPGENERGG